MPITTRLQRYLEQTATPFTHTVHRSAYKASQVARVEEIPAALLAKPVVFHTEHGFGMVVVGADCHVNLVRLRDTIGARHIRLVSENELAGLFGDTEVGAMPPFGNLYGMPVYVDSHLAEQRQIAFNAGTHKDLIHMDYSDFERLVGPSVVSVCRPE